MVMDEKERMIREKLKEIQAESPPVTFTPETVNDYLRILEERIGTVTEYNRAGYILPNGKLLDASLDNIFENNDRILSHMDVRFYGFKDNEMLRAGVIKFGECPMNEIPFIDMSLEYFFPTSEQFDVLDDILCKKPNKLDVEAKLTDNTTNKIDEAFYKRYDFVNEGDTAKIIKRDLQFYLKGDKTYHGCYDEYSGEEIRPQKGLENVEF